MADYNINKFEDFVANSEIMFEKMKESVPEKMRMSGLVREINIPNQTGDTEEFSEVDLEQYATIKDESEDHDRAKAQQGFNKIGKLYRVSKEVAISYEWRRYGKYQKIKDAMTNLGKLGPQRLDLDLTHRLTFGFVPSYQSLEGKTIDTTVGDGLPLFDTAHLLRGTSATFRNILAGNPQLSRSSLEAMEDMRSDNVLNQFGQKMSTSDDILWMADDANTVNTAKEILRSTTNPTQANPGVVNTQEGTYQMVVLPRLATDASGNPDSSKKKYWGVASSDMTSLYLGMNEEPHLMSPTPGSNAENFHNQDWYFSTAAGYMIVTPSASWVAASQGNGSL